MKVVVNLIQDIKRYNSYIYITNSLFFLIIKVIVQCIPYGESKSIDAIALQTNDHVKLKTDANPSERYMNILIEGAIELKLTDKYINFLKNEVIIAKPFYITRLLSRQHMYFTSFLFRNKMRQIQKFISNMLWFVYTPYDKSIYRILLSELCMSLILFPGAILGAIINITNQIRGKKYVTFLDVVKQKN